MSRQSLIESYFKMKASTSSSPKLEAKPNISDKKVKKRNLSLIKPTTPTKTPKVSDESKNVRDILQLCSDDEDIWENSPKLRIPCIDLTQRSNESEEASDSSMSTITYTLTPVKNELSSETEAPFSSQETKHGFLTSNIGNPSTERFLEDINSPNIVKNFQGTIKTERSEGKSQENQHNIQTPQKSPKFTSTPQSYQPSTSISPGTREKFFSPTKKRSVVKRTPNRVKRSLGMEISRTIPSRILFEDDLFTAACAGMDDKTVFLLQIVDKYLNEASLRDLLDVESQMLLTNCLQVVKPGMRLVCRLYWRKEGWYRHEKVLQISCEENEPIDETHFQQMMNSLVEKKLIAHATTQNMTFNDYASILKKDDLKQICKELKLKMNSKQDAIEALTTFSKRTSNISNFLKGCKSSNSGRVLHMMHVKAGPCYRLSDLARNTLYKLYILMYLGMDYTIIREKRLEFILIYDKIKRETYPIDKSMELDNASVVFRTRDEFERYLTAHNIYEDFLLRTDVAEKCNIVKQVYNLYKNISEEEMASYTSLPTWLHRYTPANIYVKILETGVQELKRDKTGGHNLLALEILSTLIQNPTFRQHRKAEWYAEKALILHNILYRCDEAAEVLLEGFKSNMSEEAKDSMRPRARKIARQKNIKLSDHLKTGLLEYAAKETILENNLDSKHIYKQPMDHIGKRGKVKFETRTSEGRMVQEAEEYCIGHYIYSGEFTDGEHWEGRIVTSLFSLLFWDIIYSKPAGVRGVFLSHYQLYPLDLFTDAFYANRKENIDSWLCAIEESSEDKLLSLIHDSWSNRPEGELSGFSRGGISLEQLKAVASCLRPRGVAAICRRLATNYRYTHSGFPDLTLWHATEKRIKFVEVKTDSDKPSMKQIQWMQYLRQNGIETEFCYVGVNTTRQRSRNTKSDTVKRER